jgi:hypothetical protein
MTETRFKISVPRFQRSPVDTFRFSQMIRKGKTPYQPVTTVLAEKIREIIILETGYDPFFEPVTRLGESVRARQLYMYFIRKYVKLSQLATGQLLGKNHATVNHAEKCVNKFKLLESDYRNLYCKIDDKINREL